MRNLNALLWQVDEFVSGIVTIGEEIEGKSLEINRISFGNILYKFIQNIVTWKWKKEFGLKFRETNKIGSIVDLYYAFFIFISLEILLPETERGNPSIPSKNRLSKYPQYFISSSNKLYLN